MKSPTRGNKKTKTLPIRMSGIPIPKGLNELPRVPTSPAAGGGSSVTCTPSRTTVTAASRHVSRHSTGPALIVSTSSRVSDSMRRRHASSLSVACSSLTAVTTCAVLTHGAPLHHSPLLALPLCARYLACAPVVRQLLCPESARLRLIPGARLAYAQRRAPFLYDSLGLHTHAPRIADNGAAKWRTTPLPWRGTPAVAPYHAARTTAPPSPSGPASSHQSHSPRSPPRPRPRE